MHFLAPGDAGLWERLRAEHGFTGGYTIIKDYVRERERRTREMFVPLAHPPGHAQADFGEAVKLITPQYVKPFVKWQKNDAADAEAIVVAALRPEMRFVPPKTEEQQARAVLFRACERLVHQRSLLGEAGIGSLSP